jgi:hypothetical protein
VATGVTTTVSATERAAQDVVTGVRSLSSAVQRTATDVDTAVADVTATATERVRSVIDRHVDQDTEIATKTTVNGLVSAQGAVRSSAATAATDLGGGAQTHKPGRVVKDAPKAPGVGGISDTGNEAVKGAQQTGRNVGDAVKAAHSSDDE